MSNPQTANDAASIAAFGVQATAGEWPRTDLLLINDVDVLALVTEVVRQQAHDFVGIESIDVDADQKPSTLIHTLSVMASTGIGDAAVFGVRFVHPSGNEYDETCRLIGLSMEIDGLGADIAPKFTGTLNTARND